MNKSSEDKLSKVHPALKSRIEATAEALAASGIVIQVVQGLRTYAEQDELYAQGRTKPGHKVTNARGGQSNHNFGLAADVCPFVNGQPDWNAKDAVWEAIGDAGKAQGLEWGGDWVHIVDRPHLQLPGLSVAQCAALYAKGGLKAVWAAVTVTDEPEDAPTQPLEPTPLEPAEDVAVTVNTATTTTTTPGTPPAADTVVQQQSSSVITSLASNDTVKEIAKSGVTSIGTRVSTGLASGGLLAAIDSFVTQHWAGLIFAGGLILLAVCVVIFIMWHKHSQQQQAAAINANPGQHDVVFK